MRTIDADALKELFSEVIGHIAKKPEMNGNLEHMIRASAMVIQMIDDAPTVQPDTTTYDSIPAETGENDGVGTTDDLISRQQAIVAIEQHKTAVLEGHKWDEGIEYGYAAAHRHIVDIVEQLPSVQPERIKGHWIEIASSNHTYKCSVCGRLLTNITDGKNKVAKNYPYCHCGADMRGEG